MMLGKCPGSPPRKGRHLRHLVLTPENTPDALAEAVAALRAGELVAIPTETVYGLAADAANGEAVARLFAAKGRPRFNPLICHVAGPRMAARYGVLDARALQLAARFWPGPLTIVTPLADAAPVHPLVTAGLASVGLRAPRGPAAALIAAFGGALAAPSANLSGRLSPTRAEHVIEQLGHKVALVLDAGPCPVGVESTIVAMTDAEPRLLRPGGIAATDIEEALGRPLRRGEAGDAIAAPGMMASHYAPRLPIRLEATGVRSGEALLAFGDGDVANAPGAAMVLNLSPAGNLVEAAANLFGHLALLEASGASAIAVTFIPHHGLGDAINDRLRRAAAPKGDESGPAG